MNLCAYQAPCDASVTRTQTALLGGKYSKGQERSQSSGQGGRGAPALGLPFSGGRAALEGLLDKGVVVQRDGEIGVDPGIGERCFQERRYRCSV